MFDFEHIIRRKCDEFKTIFLLSKTFYYFSCYNFNNMLYSDYIFRSIFIHSNTQK